MVSVDARSDSGPLPSALRAKTTNGAARRRKISVFGATGSIGGATLDVVRAHGGAEAFDVVALTAQSNVAKLAQQAREFDADVAVVGDPAAYSALREALTDVRTEAACGGDALAEAGGLDADWVMAAIVGAAGLESTLAAARRGATVALANKETLVCAGELFLAELAQGGGALLPVDSEHNAIFQCFETDRPAAVERIILTASGGPFRTWSQADMASVTPEQALKHPNWSMGAKISIDSATMFNKALEVIEAARLFPVPHEAIEVVVHPQSVVHSMVGYCDGSVLAQLGAPDMRTPIAYALGWPDRIAAPVERLDFAALGKLEFEAPDPARFPSLRLCRAALAQGGAAPAVLNAANEVAVDAFFAGRIGFLAIAEVVEAALEAQASRSIQDLDDVRAADAEGRRAATAAIARLSDA